MIGLNFKKEYEMRITNSNTKKKHKKGSTKRRSVKRSKNNVW